MPDITATINSTPLIIVDQAPVTRAHTHTHVTEFHRHVTAQGSVPNKKVFSNGISFLRKKK